MNRDDINTHYNELYRLYSQSQNTEGFASYLVELLIEQESAAKQKEGIIEAQAERIDYLENGLRDIWISAATSIRLDRGLRGEYLIEEIDKLLNETKGGEK